MVGARVIKTCLAVMISVYIAKALNLYSFQFAGIIAVLSVQPSINRSLKYAVQLTASAVIGAILGVVALFALGSWSFLVMGVVTFIIMVLHVKVNWTSTLLVSAVIGINTMGTVETDFWHVAWDQIALVLIGVGAGILINLIHKPVHQERAEVVLKQSEGMLRALLHFMHFGLQNKQITPYTTMKIQIDEIRGYIRKGKEISSFINEDNRFRRTAVKNTSSIFESFKTMLERINDMAKALANFDIIADEIKFSEKSLHLLIRMQENIIRGKKMNPRLFKLALDKKRNQIWQASDGSEDITKELAFFNFYGYIIEYLQELEHFLVENTGLVKKSLTYVSVDRPGLIAEISGILLKNNLNITDVSIQVSGDFATTSIKVSCPASFESGEMLAEILMVKGLLTGDFN
jgi:uncharacterized membrane protein YgaE (UPF0421/DUF939 family)/predicted amino acid-binding ACT domain protein